jgi:hypothetical protein
MTIPGFTAEASLPSTSNGRWISAGMRQTPTGQGIVPQVYTDPDTGCDMFIDCVDGILYLVRDCPDGSGDETKIGVCSLRTRLAQDVHSLIRRPWLLVRQSP